MNHLSRAAMKCNRLMEVARPGRRLPSTFFISPRLFSTEASNPGSAFSGEHLFETSPSGSVYGRLSNIFKYTTKRDAINLIDCDLSPENLKVEYDQSYNPRSMIVEFPSQSAYDVALKTIAKKGRFFNLSRADKSQWDMSSPYDGKAIVMVGIPRNALIDDVEHFLSGCQYDSSSMQLFVRPTDRGIVRMALVRFPSQTSAMHAYITKNHGFCLNNQISLRLLN